MTLKEIKKDPRINAFIDQTDKYLKKMGYTDHGRRHSNIVSQRAISLSKKIGLNKKEAKWLLFVYLILRAGRVWPLFFLYTFPLGCQSTSKVLQRSTRISSTKNRLSKLLEKLENLNIGQNQTSLFLLF